MTWFINKCCWAKWSGHPRDVMKSLPSTSRILTFSNKTLHLSNMSTTVAFYLIVDQSKINVMILGFSAHSQPSSLDSRKDNSNELAKAGRIQWRYALGATPRCIMRENAITRHRTAALFANRV